MARIDPGLVAAEVLNRVDFHGWSQLVRIAVMHHPPSPLPSTEVWRYAGLLNGGAVKQVLMNKGFSLVLCGHAHSGWFTEERWLGQPGTEMLRIAAAPSLGSWESPENNGYNVVEVFREWDREDKTTCQVEVRCFIRKGERA